MPTGQLHHLQTRAPRPAVVASGDSVAATIPARPRPATRMRCVYVDASDFAARLGPTQSLVLPHSERAVALPLQDTVGDEPRMPRVYRRVLTTVLMTDVVESTRTAAQLGDRRWSDLLVGHYADSRAAVASRGGEFIDTTGDGIVATFDTPTRAVQASASIRAAARRRGIAVRAGIHAGECERVGAGVAGIAIHIAARVCALGGPDDIIATGTVCELMIGSTVRFEPRGVRTLRGVPGRWRLFQVSDSAS